MEFKFYIYKTGNLFHFISNLTEWHFSCRRFDNEFWLKKTGPLTQKEKGALKNLKKLLIKYNFGENFLGKPLMGFSEKEAKERLTGLVTRTELNKINKSLDIFEERFEKIWKNEYTILKQWKKKLESSRINEEEIAKTLNIYFDTVPNPNKALKVYLLISSPNYGLNGGANIGTGKITVEISDIALFERATATICHEAIHSLYREKIHNEIEKYLTTNKVEKELLDIWPGRSIFNLFNEAIVSSLTPQGYLSEKFFNLIVQNNTKSFIKSMKKNKKIRSYIARKMYSTTKDYIENKKQLDQGYIRKVHKSYLDYLRVVEK